jgi:hypothetical protein
MDMRPSTPRSIGETLDDAVRLYRSSFAQWWLPSVVLAVVPIVWGVTVGVDVVRAMAANDPGAMVRSMTSPLFLAGILVMMVGLGWAFSALYVGLNGAYVGAPPGLGESAMVGLRLLPRLIVIGALTMLIVVLGLVALVVPGIYLAGRLQLTGPVLAAERAGVFASVSRAWNLTQGHWWRAMTVLGVAAVIQLVISLALAMLLIVVGVAFRGEPALASLFTLAVQGIERFFVAPFLPIAGIVLYHDLKLRVDGDDLERRAEALAAR